VPQNSRPNQLHFREDTDSESGGHDGGVFEESATAQETTAMKDPTDGMGAIVFTDEEDSGFFGPSSNIAFTRHISRAVARVSHISHVWSTPGTQDSMALEGGLMSVSRPPSPTHGRLGARRGPRQDPGFLYDLPADEETMVLVRQYFADTGLLFPYIHEESFLDTYEEMKRTNFSKIRRTWLGLLNMVLAMSTSTAVNSNLSAEKRAEISDVFYQRALGLCDKQIMRGTSLEVVQSLLMMGQYLQGTQKSIQTWTIHGLAVKAAFQLGLHSSEALKRFPPLEREIRKRAWYGCVVLDRTLSMTFGRPAAVPDDYIKLELPSAYEIFSAADAPNQLKDNSLHFFNATITLYKVMWKVTDSLYGGNIGCEEQPNVFDTVARLFQMEHQLVEWKSKLPPQMELVQSEGILSANDDVSPSERYRIILTLRYHNLRILIHRLILVKFLDLSGKATADDQQLILLQQIGSNSVKICVQSATEIISIVNIVVHSTGARRTLLGAWWFSLYYTFNAALVIFASLLVCQNFSVVGPFLPTSIDVSRRSLDKAVDALQLLDNGNRMVEKCRTYLRQLGFVLDMLSSNQFPTSAETVSVISDHVDLNRQAFENNVTFTMSGNNFTTNQSPLGMDLGEFMTEGDLEFLNHFSMPVNGIDNRAPTNH